MDKPKVFLCVFIAAILVLFLCLLLIPKSHNVRQISALVINNTLTQSLDGQRRYLTVDTQEAGIIRVLVPTATNCPEGSNAILTQPTKTLVAPLHS
uniref:hypothetical protein n=1 Tax=Vibrio alfacsensis TaxID=1074311 RepID=UPI001F49AF07|nr:hypothetical protein [Vibrio alfacsensis]